MEEAGSFLKKIEAILEKDPDYKFEAYTFVLAALHDTVSKLKKPRHITGKELALGIRKYTLDQFGPMAKTVLHHWGIHTTLDFGKIVYALIDVQLLSRQPEDKLEDFDKVYDFEEAFGKYKIDDESL
ncbi:MAG: Minf_1886 family protein [Candidatus Omnitrophota bacterium]